MVETWKFQKGTHRCWLQELPPVPPLQGQLLELEVPAQASVISQRVEAGVERKIVGDSSYYGLLGGVFEPNPDGATLLINITTQAATQPWSETTSLYSFDPILIGLETEYQRAILAVLHEEGSLLGAGILSINRACVAKVGSSGLVFAILTKYLVKCLLVSADMSQLSELESLLNGSVSISTKTD